MPNHVATRLIIEGDKAEKHRLIDAVTVESKDEDGLIEYDFRRLYPMPVELKGTSSPARIISEAEYAAQEAERAKSAKNVCHDFYQSGITQKMSDEFIAKYGANNWYDWCRNNWGTKWGTYDVSLNDDGTFSYNTAWSPATLMFLHFSKQFPTLKFITRYADEGGGFVGGDEIQNGKLLAQHSYDWDSPEGIAIRQDVGYWYEDEDEDEE